VHITKDKLKSLLVTSGLVDDKAFAEAWDESTRLGQEITNTLVGRGVLSEDYLNELLEPYFGVTSIDLKTLTIPKETLELVPESYAKSKGVILFELDQDKKTAKLAMIDPLDLDTIEFLRTKLSVWIEPFLISQSGLKYALKQYKKKIGEEFNKIISENVEKFMSEAGETDVSKLAEAVPIVSILDSIIEHAASLNASDIHFEPLQGEVLIRFRVDGIMHEMLSLNKNLEPILVARVKILAGMQLDEHRTPQDGRFRFEIEGGVNIVDIRVNVMPIMHGEKVEMRLLKSTSRPLTLEELGLSGNNIILIKEEIKKPHGMVLVTGPTGHGKTTTLYAILHILNTPEVNIVTIEDPIEYEMKRINQTQVNTKAGITFANGLRSLMRQNPDIILIGEIRDNETVEIAIHAALTGHMVLSSLHTNDAPSALPRLLDMSAPAFLLASTINVIVAQRLVRKICRSCIESYPISPETSRLITAQLALTGDDHIKKIPQNLYRGKGCKICGNSGFQGQIGIYEVLRVTEGIRDLVLKQSSGSEIRKQAIKEGMEAMFEDGLQKVEQGTTTIEEVIRVVRE